MRIKSHAPFIYAGMTAAGVVTLAFMGIYAYLMRQDGRDRWFFYTFLAPFVLAGTLLTYFGGRFLLRLARFGSWQLDVPGSGGELGRALAVTLFPTRARSPTGELICRCGVSVSASRPRVSRPVAPSSRLCGKPPGRPARL